MKLIFNLLLLLFVLSIGQTNSELMIEKILGAENLTSNFVIQQPKPVKDNMFYRNDTERYNQISLNLFDISSRLKLGARKGLLEILIQSQFLQKWTPSLSIDSITLSWIEVLLWVNTRNWEENTNNTLNTRSGSFFSFSSISFFESTSKLSFTGTSLFNF